MKSNIRSAVVLVCALMLMTQTGCRIIKRVTQSNSSENAKRPQYVHYGDIFDLSNENLLTPTQAQSFSTDNKIKIITINKITNDTIIEWVDPIEINTGKRIFVNNADVETIRPIQDIMVQVKDSLPTHREFKVEYNEKLKKPTYFLRKDTLILKGSYQDIAALLLASNKVSKLEADLQRLKGNKQSKENKTVKTQAINKGRKRQIANANKPRSNKSDTISTKVISTKPAVVAEVKDAPKVISIDSSIKISEEQLTVGDPMFDKDPSATILNDQQLITQLLSPRIQNWNTFKSKAKIHYKSKGKSQSFNANIRMRKDSVTWASIILLGELARAVLTQDSVMALDKWNDVYYTYPIQALQEQFNLPIQFEQIQNILLGNMVNTHLNPVLAKKSSKGFAIKLIGDGYHTVANYQKDSTLRSVVVMGTNSNGRFTLKSTYDDYEETSLGKLAMKRAIRMYQNNQETTVSLELQKCEFEIEQEYPFSIPSKFKQGEIKKKN